MTTPRTIRVVLRPAQRGTDAAFSASQRLELEAPELEELGVFVVFDGTDLYLEAFDDQTLSTPSDREPRAVCKLTVVEPVDSTDGWRFTVTRQTDGAWALEATPKTVASIPWLPAPALDDALLLLPDVVRAVAIERASVGSGDVAAGLVLRFGQTSIQGILAGRDRPGELVVEWWQLRSQDEREAVAGHAHTLARAVASTAAHLLSEEAVHTSSWADSVTALCLQRDHLASLRTALRRLNGLAPEAAAFQQADHLLLKLFGSLLAPVVPTHPYLRWVGARRGSFWSRPGGEDLG